MENNSYVFFNKEPIPQFGRISHEFVRIVDPNTNRFMDFVLHLVKGSSENFYNVDCLSHRGFTGGGYFFDREKTIKCLQKETEDYFAECVKYSIFDHIDMISNYYNVFLKGQFEKES